MKTCISSILIFTVLLAAAIEPRVLAQPAQPSVVFATSDGKSIVLDAGSEAAVTSSMKKLKIRDCGDVNQFCITDYHGFAFSYFKKCNDISANPSLRLKFPPRIVSIVHDHVWMVFDASPNFLFHYVIGQGIVGINMGTTPSFDFRSVLHNKKFGVSDLAATEYQITGSRRLASCLTD